MASSTNTPRSREVTQYSAPTRITVRRVLPHRTGDGAYVETDDAVGLGDPKDSTRFIQAQLCHPININTAPQSVVEACFMGVCIYSGKEAIRRQTAQLLAEFLLKADPVV